ncbi:MAG: hypothetical protein ACMG6E_01735 [Candidatus Roizmanbacteria bacterium]
MGIAKGELINGTNKKAAKEGKSEIVRKNCYLSIFSGCKIPVDVSIYGYKYMCVAIQIACEKVDVTIVSPPRELILSYWLELYFELMISFLESGITPIPTFDGKPFRLKDETAEERRAKFLKEDEQIIALRTKMASGDLTKNTREALKRAVTNHIIFLEGDWNMLKEMFKAMGLPVVQKDFEAEAVGARLCRRGIAPAIATDDSDCLAHGAPIMIRKVKKSYMMGQPFHECQCIIRNDLLEVLELDEMQFLDFCILIGTDYNKRIKGIGFVKGLTFIRDHGNLEAAVAVLSTKNDLTGHRLNEAAIRHEIRGYFADELDFQIVETLVMNYEETNYELWVKSLCSEIVREKVMRLFAGGLELLVNFNQKFARMQKFVLVPKEDSDEQQGICST